MKIVTDEVRSEDLVSIYTNIYKHFDHHYYRVYKEKAVTASGTVVDRTATTACRIANLGLAVKGF